MSNQDEMDLTPDLVSLLDDDGNEYEFEIMAELDYEDGHYYALVPLFQLPDEDDDDNENVYMIFEAVEDENGEPQLAEVEDELLLDKIAEQFEAMMDEMSDDFEEE